MKQKVSELKTLVNSCKTQLIELILSLPEAEDGVKRLGPRCGVVSFSTIQQSPGMILCPSYYLTAQVKDVLIEKIKKMPLENIDNYLETLIKEGTIVVPGERRQITVSKTFLRELTRKWNNICSENTFTVLN
jgi:hypothetical protein